MAFARHETFYFREGWLTKGLKAVNEDQGIFMAKDAMERLGIGSNMVKALRYWMMATGLTTENTSGKRVQTFTPLGKIIYKFDKYLEEPMTLWLLHYQLAINDKLATAWYWFFNVFNHREFDEGLFLEELKHWVKIQGEEVSEGSLKKDFDCIISTYCPSKNPVANPEDNIVCPLQELELIEQVDAKKRVYRFTRKNISEMPLELFHFALMDYMRQQKLEKHISLDILLSGPKALGRVFALGLADLIEVLRKLEEEGYTRFIRTAGLNHVSVLSEQCPEDILEDYYQRLNAEEIVGVV